MLSALLLLPTTLHDCALSAHQGDWVRSAAQGTVKRRVDLDFKHAAIVGEDEGPGGFQPGLAALHLNLIIHLQLGRHLCILQHGHQAQDSYATAVDQNGNDHD